MRFVRQIGEKGQVVIPKDIRGLLGVRPRQKIVFEIAEFGKKNQEIKIKAQKSDVDKDIEEFFTIARTKGKDLTSEELKKIEDESYDLP
jgi:bifunctional DNA-binding transcriptional regulator/antitoxin component of YhaV-PrlF toxin-antitoxin module